MAKTLSMDIRDRFRRYIEDGWTACAAGRALKISAAAAVRFRHKIMLGQTLEAKPRGGHPGTGKLAGFRAFLIELVRQDPDITLFELRDALKAAHGVRVRQSFQRIRIAVRLVCNLTEMTTQMAQSGILI